jgi:multidrug resistance protein
MNNLERRPELEEEDVQLQQDCRRCHVEQSKPGILEKRMQETKDIEKPYTTFTRREQWLITAIMGVAMFFSPMTANIYFPAIPVLAEATSSSIQDVNLTITTYIILQGISPLFVGDLADKFGRRPIYLLTFAIYVGASLGLSLNPSSYVGLMVLRTVQSAGCSATAAIGYGVLADVAMPSKRGSMLGAAMVAANTGPTIGPLLGGVITGGLGWRWIFWFLTILGCGFICIVWIAFPETSRQIVDNGSVQAPRANRPLVAYFCRFPRNAEQRKGLSSRGSLKSRFRVPNPIPALRIIFYRDAFLVLVVSAIHYMAYYCLQATMPALFAEEPYKLTSLQTGLTYLSIGIGVALGGFINGKFLDHNYRRTARDIGFVMNVLAGDRIQDFPIERARTRFATFLLPAHLALLIGYGWAAEYHVHLSVLLMLQFALGFVQTCIVQTFNTLLVDIFPKKPSTASAAGNITRCLASALGVAAVEPLTKGVGWGWVFTIFAIVCGIFGNLAVVGIRRWGWDLRKGRV